jgi:hypothetical protein
MTVRFSITLNMPAKSGNQIHQIIGEHEAESLAEFVDIINHENFIVVNEMYKDTDSGGRLANLYLVGEIAINCDLIGKVKVYTP